MEKILSTKVFPNEFQQITHLPKLSEAKETPSCSSKS